MVFHTGSSSKTTVTRTTHTSTTGSPGLLGNAGMISGTPTLLGGTGLIPGHTTTILPGGATTTTTTQYVTSAQGVPQYFSPTMPLMQQAYVTGAAPAGMWTTAERTVVPAATTTRMFKPLHLGRLSMTPFRPTYTTAQASARMGLAPLGQPHVAQVAHNSSNVTYSNSASLVLSGIECAGYIAIANNQIVEAKNIFIGVAPFILSPETLEVTEDMTVVARNPDIRYHLGDLPNETQQALTLAELANLAEIPQGSEIWIGLPGQQAGRAVETDGVLKIEMPAAPAMLGTFGAPMLM